jgi:DNA-binding HxlR family transcriptional regulator
MTRTPKPGARVRGSRSGRPVMALLDLLGRRWALRVLWELRGQPQSFRALRTACGEISPSVLNDRLRELRESGLVELSAEQGYALSPLGHELIEHATPLLRWSERWARARPG